MIKFNTNVIQEGEYLPPAPYSISKQINGREYIHSACPGGIIAPCQLLKIVVTNGWSPSKRDYPSSNSGIVVELKNNDFNEFLNIMYLQD